MGSDRARNTYDPKQQYRSVVMQQGRVTLEADWNEAQQIAEEEMRREMLDIVGPAGTSDDGYRVVIPPLTVSHRFDFAVQKGSMYVGGLRTWLGDPVFYSNQPDWRDFGPEDPDWVDVNSFLKGPPAHEFVYLLLREQEVSAVEDPHLQDVALGGPDTAQRTRLLQRFVRLPSMAADCASGLAAAQAHWLTEGLSFDAEDMRLHSAGRLWVGAADQQPAPNPCQPRAQGGYVDPDNQLIRVQISGIDPLTGNPKFLWGFDDASFLYRIEIDPNNPQNLLLQAAPVDSAHQPARGQAVEVLRTAADLANGGFAAATSGFPFTLDKNYDPDAQAILLPNGVSLPADYVSGALQSPPVPHFLRVWQEEKVFTPGVATALGDTGLQVTLQTANGGAFHIGDYWMFAARPATPQTVYPERYWNGFQPPEGPRLWACPLAVLAWLGREGTVVADCRNVFDNLVDLSRRQEGCCTISVRPRDLTATKTLQSILESASSLALSVAAVDAGSTGNNIAISVSNLQPNLSPATFDLSLTESETYPALTLATIVSAIGDERTQSPTLAHLLRSSLSESQSAVPAEQSATFSAAQISIAQASVFDASGEVVFTLEAKRPGADGNLTTATISNINTSVTPNTFDLTLSWSKTLPGLTPGNLTASAQAGLGYEINVAGHGSRARLPLEGVTMLAGGVDASGNTPATAATANLFGAPSKLCLAAGTYFLPQPLQIGSALSHLTIEACGGAVTLTAAPGTDSLFAQGLVTITGASNITVNGLNFKMPRLQPLSLLAVARNIEGLSGARSTQPKSATASIAIRTVDCQSLTIENCTFNYPQTVGVQRICAGVFASGECLGLSLRDNRFNGPSNFLPAAGNTEAIDILVCGYLQTSSATRESTSESQTSLHTSSVLDDASFSGNSFRNLFFPVLVLASCGTIGFEGNVIRACPLGILLSTLALPDALKSTEASTTVNTTKLNTVGISNDLVQSLIAQNLAATSAFRLPSSYVARSTVALRATPAATSASTVLRAAVNVAAVTAPSLTANLRIANNDIDVILSATIGGGQTVLITENSKLINSTLIMSGNRLRNQSATAPTVSIEGVGRSAITGNIILNEQPSAASGAAGAPGPPSLVAAGTVAVSGNILLGQPALPARNATLPYGAGILAPPMNRWEAYNTEN